MTAIRPEPASDELRARALARARVLQGLSPRPSCVNLGLTGSRVGDNGRKDHTMAHREAPELGAACVRMFRALARRAGDGELEALEQLAFLQDSLQIQLGAAVAGYREGHGFSWTDVGNVLGITRQAAQQRFRKATTAPAHPVGRVEL